MGRVTHVKAYSATLAHAMETEDVATAALRFESGALGSIVATTAAFPGVGTSICVYGDRGSAVIGDDKLSFLQLARDIGEVGAYGAGTPKYLSAGTGPAGTAADPAALNAGTHAQQIGDMIRAIREHRDPLLDGNAARHPVDIILAIYESSRTGLEVELP
jgi:predicted dehydrogenase